MYFLPFFLFLLSLILPFLYLKDLRQYNGVSRIKGKFLNESIKIYRDEKGVLCGDVWEISTLHASAKERVGYATQKPKELIKRIIEASSNENDVVADFYLGCGTTALVCKELNRKFIGCDINSKAIELTNKRLNETLL